MIEKEFCDEEEDEDMKCPFCGEENTKVIDSRPADDNSSIRRRRQCEQCNKRFTTYEKLETIPLVVMKKDMAREPYDRSKIERGLFRSCTKLPISIDRINEVVDDIENEIFNLGEKEVSSKYIGERVMEHLKELDPVAYVRFASIYREFKDVNTFMNEIKKILDNQ
jgi:transcriptional repressor NrdR